VKHHSRAGRVGLLGGVISAIALVLLLCLTDDAASVYMIIAGVGAWAVSR
jgi:hypothetical protein